MNLNELSLPILNNGNPIIKHEAITLQYNSAHSQSEWVGYYLTKDRIQGSVSRKNNFRQDNLITNRPVQPNDYRGSRFDRGHLAPAADFSWSEEAMSDSFLMTNISPQEPNFNRGIWKKLESQIRFWTESNNDTLIIVTGPVLRQNLASIGKNIKISIPEYFFKAILSCKRQDVKTIGFIFRNESSQQPLSHFAISIDSLEKITQIDFLISYPNRLNLK